MIFANLDDARSRVGGECAILTRDALERLLDQAYIAGAAAATVLPSDTDLDALAKAHAAKAADRYVY